MKKLNENFKRLSSYKPSYSSKTVIKEDDENNPVETFKKLQDLIKTGDEMNITLALQIAEGQKMIYYLKRWVDDYFGMFFKADQKDDLKSKIMNVVNMRDLTINKFETPKIKKLPSVIKSMKALEYLYVADIDLSEFPKEICSLTNLNRLSLNGGSYTIPQCITNLSNSLEKLIIKNYNGNPINNNLLGLSKLDGLHIVKCNIKNIPDDIMNLKNLKILNISYSGLEKVNPNLAKLPIQDLLLIGNNLTVESIPQEILDMNVNLSLYGNDISDEEIYKLNKENVAKIQQV